jgi:hypothetical protein
LAIGGVMVVSRRRTLFAGVAALVLGAILAFLVPTHWRYSRLGFGPDESRPLSDTHIGLTREQIIAELGEPKVERKGHYGAPPDDYIEQHAGARTLYWEWWSVHFYASIEEIAGRWVCFSSDWVPRGCVID